MPSRAAPIGGGGSRPRNQALLQSPPDIIPASLPTSTTTPPYTPGDELPRRKSRASHVPPPGPMASSAPPMVIMPPPLQFYPAQPYSSPSDSTSPAYSPMGHRQDQYFTPQSFPMNPYFQSLSGSTTPWQTVTEDEGFETTEYDFPDMTEDMSTMVDFDAGETASMASASMMTKTSTATLTPGKKRASHTPRPPNAWILYRSDKLKAIAAGEKIPGLEAIMAEMGTSSSGSASGADSSAEDAKKHVPGKKGDMPPPEVPKRVKGKKGAKEPTEGLLSLGRGKGGRGLPQADISKMISMLWKREAQQTRGEYERRAEMKKLEHQEKFPGYKFQPLRRADKIKMREDREREREALKREKELARSGTRSRRARTRTRASPSSPYSLSTTERYTNLPSQTLTYDPPPPEPAPTDQVFWAGGPGHNLPTTQVSVSDSQLGSYPFPMPHGALPSLDNEDTPSFPFALDLSGPTPIGQPSGSDLQFATLPEANNALDRGQMQFLSVPQDPSGQQGFGQVTSLKELQQTYDIVPMYLEFPTEGLPPSSSELDQEGVSPGQSADPNALAALWCMIEEENDESGPSGLTPDDRAGLMPWNAEARQAEGLWAQQPGMPPPSRFPTLAPQAYSMAEPPAEYRAAYDPSGHYLTIPYPMQGGPPASFQDGPFLPHQPLSPDQPWPQQSLRSSFSSNISDASTPAGLPVSYRAPSNAPPPRYVSASQYPPTPVSTGQPDSAFVEELAWEEPPQPPAHTQPPVEPMPPQAMPPRGARRGRTVGMKFDGR